MAEIGFQIGISKLFTNLNFAFSYMRKNRKWYTMTFPRCLVICDQVSKNSFRIGVHVRFIDWRMPERVARKTYNERMVVGLICNKLLHAILVVLSVEVILGVTLTPAFIGSSVMCLYRRCMIEK